MATELAYYPGCSLHASSELYDVQCKLVLEEMGLKLRELDDWSCCGATSASKTDEFLSIALPARNLGIAEATGLKEMLIPCSSCLSRTLMARKALNDNEALRERVSGVLELDPVGDIKISNIMEVLQRQIDAGAIEGKVTHPLEGIKAACYYGCLLTRFPRDIEVADDVENPQSMEKVLKDVGAETIEWGYKTDCCGASASVNDSGVALGLMEKIMKDALARGANAIVTSCPMCQFNLDAYQSKLELEGKALPVYFITELIGLALGISPDAMQLDRHLTDTTGLLRELKLL